MSAPGQEMSSNPRRSNRHNSMQDKPLHRKALLIEKQAERARRSSIINNTFQEIEKPSKKGVWTKQTVWYHS
jgi:hypothetical protein